MGSVNVMGLVNSSCLIRCCRRDIRLPPAPVWSDGGGSGGGRGPPPPAPPAAPSPAPLAAPSPAPPAGSSFPAPPLIFACHEYSLPVSMRLDTEGDCKAVIRSECVYYWVPEGAATD
jgi:hypothetical protein